MSSPGDILERGRRAKRSGRWKLGLFFLMGALLAANLFIRPQHVEFGLDACPGFWGAFGFVVSVLMVLIMKKAVQPLLGRPEEIDEHDD